MDIPRLQGLIKKDPESYKEEFLAQQQRFESKLKLLELQPSKEDDDFVSLVSFLCHTVPCYPEKDTARFPIQLLTMLEEKYAALDKETRKSILQGLIILRNRNRVAPLRLLLLCFTLFRVQDKELRAMVYRYIVNDIQNVNKKHKSEKINRTLQHQLYTVLEDKTNEVAAKKSLDVMVELYKRQVWFDNKTVNVISTAVFNPSPRICVKALRFLLGENLNDDLGDSDDEEAVRQKTMKEIYASAKFSKKSKSRLEKVKKTMHDHRNKAQRRQRKEEISESGIILALNDPQGFAEKLFVVLKKSTLKFEARLLMMNVLSRCIAMHQLVLLNFYPYMQKYLRPHQQEITFILALLAQACHIYVPPDVLLALIKVITKNFVNEGCSNELMTVGINSIREICLRNPDAITEDLLSDLVMYKDQKDKGVSIAGRSLLRLYRQMNPSLLPKSLRGKPKEIDEDEIAAEPNAIVSVSRIEGIELLERDLREDSSDESDEDGASEDEEEQEEEGDASEEEVLKLEVGKGKSDKAEEVEGKQGKQASSMKDDVPLEATRALTQEEFQRLKILRLKRKVAGEEEEDERPKKKKKNESTTEIELDEHMEYNSSDLEDSDDERPNFLGSEDIIGYQSRKRRTLEERLDAVRAGREGREKFGSKKANKKENKSTTNSDKKRNQPFMMAKYRQASHKKKASKDSAKSKQTNFKGKVRK